MLNMPPQVFRLLLLVLAILASYFTARYLLTPRSFGQHGWYRGDALAEVAAPEPVYAGTQACEECHFDHHQKLQKHEHRSLACEGCHGPGRAHADNPDIKLQVLNYSHCVRCHEANPSRPKWHKQIVGKDHYAGSKCTECHVPHAPSEVP
jgi:hypothetical protein